MSWVRRVSTAAAAMIDRVAAVAVAVVPSGIICSMVVMMMEGHYLVQQQTP